MEIITDILSDRKEIETCIRRYGYQAEHNFMHFAQKKTANTKPVFLKENGCGVLATVSKKGIWSLVAEPVAPADKRIGLLYSFCNHAVGHGKKAVLEVTEPVAALFRQGIGYEKLRALRDAYVLYWPVYDLAGFDPSLPGKEWKKMRNIMNCVKNKHKVESVPSTEIRKEKLKELVLSWKKRRKAKDRVDTKYYFNLIDGAFEGFDMTRTLLIDGKPSTITGGWRIPNSKDYYSSLGLLDYGCNGIGEYANIDDLGNIKRAGYRKADFGGSDEQLLGFKKKFRPESIYKTCIFSVVRKI
jgi:hypothetical protein